MGSASMAGRRMWLAGGLALPLALGLAMVSAPAMAVASTAGAPTAGGGCYVTSAKPVKGPGGDVKKTAKKTARETAKETAKKRPKAAAPVMNGGGSGCPGPRGPKGDRGPAGQPGPCADVDSAKGPADLEFSAAISKGRTFIGVRKSQPTPGPYAWKNLTGPKNPGYPKNACSVSVESSGPTVYVKVLTVSGDVYENTCTIAPSVTPALNCQSGWTALVKP
ncbi:hypothetical protein [Streptomyces sp. G-G2]|uniref:hypothetical protein n=1 Tax=Streptomyces sp. G-G2 TaxID=3046201 RepID=UPI0024BBAAA0|nr:hypothetical protein [Streptomyces sp. G-G2]MDJ0384120.1 hypothetical protein [Streptomyces sp. G-G2]